MFVTYTPEDGDRQEWVWDPTRIRATEGQVLLREYGEKNWDLFVQAVRENDLHARRVLLWHLIRRDHPLVKFKDTPDFYTDELEVQMSSAELAKIHDNIEQAPAPAEQKATALAVFDVMMQKALEREATLDRGKASSPTSGTESTTTG